MLQEPSSTIPARGRRLGLFAVLCVAGVLAVGSACEPTLVSVTVTAQKTSLPRGTTVQLRALGSFSNGTTGDLTSLATWSSADAAVATVSAAGLALGAAPGRAAVLAGFRGVTGSLSLTVTAAALTGVTVSPLVAAIANGTTHDFTATGTFSDGTTQDITGVATWAVDPARATLTGPTQSAVTATGTAVGWTPVKASFMDQSGGATLIVTSAVLTKLTVVPGAVSLAKSTTAYLRAIGTFSDDTAQDLTSLVTWHSTSSAVAAVSSPPTGLLTAMSPGVAQVTASLGPITGSASFTVTAATLVSIAITPQAPVLAKGTGAQLAAIGTFSDGTTQVLTGSATWTSSQTEVGTVSSGASAGQVTTLAQGTATLTATFMGVSGTAVLTVTEPSLISIAVTAPSTTPPLGTTTQLTATGTLSDGTTQDLTSAVEWHSTPPGAAEIDPLGLLTTKSAGPVSVTASLGPTTSPPLIVLIDRPVLVSLEVSACCAQIAVGTSTQVVALGTYSDGSQLDLSASVVWTVAAGGEAIAYVVAPGLIQAIGPGVAIAVATDPSGISGSTAIHVTGPAVESIDVSAISTALPVGATTQLTAIGHLSDGTDQDLTSLVTWHSLPPGQLLVDQSGLLIAQAEGPASVTAVLGDVTSGSQDITVSSATLVSITVTAQALQIAQGCSVQLTATGTYSDGTTQPITGNVHWQSSDDTIAAPVASGLILGVAPGAATITAAQGGISGTLDVSVTDNAPALLSLTITPGAASVSPGGTLGFTATGAYSDGSAKDVSSQVTWSSSAPGVATISNTPGTRGLAAAVAVTGATAIGASLGLVAAPVATLTVE